jgi:hypothetical protein
MIVIIRRQNLNSFIQSKDSSKILNLLSKELKASMEKVVKSFSRVYKLHGCSYRLDNAAHFCPNRIELSQTVFEIFTIKQSMRNPFFRSPEKYRKIHLTTFSRQPFISLLLSVLDTALFGRSCPYTCHSVTTAFLLICQKTISLLLRYVDFALQ